MKFLYLNHLKLKMNLKTKTKIKNKNSLNHKIKTYQVARNIEEMKEKVNTRNYIQMMNKF